MRIPELFITGTEERGIGVTDRELVRKLHTGDRSALDGIVKKYYDDIYKFSLYMTATQSTRYR